MKTRKIVYFTALFLALTPLASTEAATKKFTLAQVKQHATVKSCWSVINGSVYDLTPFINRHPGGANMIINICGKNGTQLFKNFHNGAPRPAAELRGLRIGKLG